MADTLGCGTQAVAAGQTNAQLGATGAIGDYLHKIVLVPATLSPGAVTIKDGAGSAVTVFAGGANSLLELRPIEVAVEGRAAGAGWKITTGANVSAIAVGRFT